MTNMIQADNRPPTKFDAEEWSIRCELAALYRLVAHFRMTDLIYTHISARLPGPDHYFLINEYGALFHEIRASDLVKINVEGEMVEIARERPQRVNPAGFTIHSAIHMHRPDLKFVLHTHTAAGMAVSAQEHGLLPITQIAMKFFGRIGYHDYEGLALNIGERERIVADLGPHNALILRNHGLLVGGPTAARTFNWIYFLERACQAQVAALGGGAQVVTPSHDVARKVAAQFARPGRHAPANAWAALLRMLDREDPAYRD